MHELRLLSGFRGDPSRGKGGVTMLLNDPLGGIDQERARG
jgi:hypothetical protein